MIGRVKRVPEEVARLIGSGGSFLVKGMAGSGKTSFVLSILEEFAEGTPVYLSTRLSREAFYRFFPQAKKFLGDDGFVDARAPKVLPREGRLPLKFASAPEFVEALYLMLENARKPRVAVIDSLDALKFTLNIPYDEISLERLLLEVAEATDSSMVFVAETDKGTPLDYVVDGVAVLRWKTAKGFFLREIYIEKVRGEKIVFPVRCFTLKDGVFRLIEAQRYELGESVNPPPIKRITPRFIPTNIEELDEVLGGGLRRGGLTILEVDMGVGVDYRWIAIPFILNAVMQGCIAVFIPSTGFSRLDVESSFKPFLKEEELRKHIHIVQFAEGGEEENVHVVEGGDPLKDAERVLEVAEPVSVRDGSKDAVMFIGTDTLEYVYGPDGAIKMLSKIVVSSRMRGHTLLLIAKYGQTKRDVLFHMADAHFRLENVNSITLIQGVNPPTKVYAISVDEEECFRTKLIPVE